MARQKRRRQGPSAVRDNPAQTKAGPNRKRKVVFAAVSAGVLGLAGYFLWPAVKVSSLFAPPGEAVEVAVSMAGFAPARLAVREGQPITIRLVNKDNRFHTDGGGWHQFAIDALGVDVKVPPLATETVTFVPDKTGVFEFYCDVCCGGRANPYMRGALTVST